jgi:segregation and condensation protein B
MSKDKAPKDSVVTLIENPFHINTIEISDAQNIQDELELDQSDDFELEGDIHEASAEEVDEQFEKLAQAIEKQAPEAPLQLEVPSEEILASQIAEDQALALEEEQEREELAKAESSAVEPPLVNLDESEVQSCIEAILFISDKPLSLAKLKDLLGPQFELSLFQEALQKLQSRYQAVHHGIELIEVSGGYQFRTKPGRAELAQKLVKVQTQKLSSGMMETLAIIAYKQPVMKEDIDKVRGVDSSYFVRGLIDRKLIKISGRSELPGRPLLYSSTPEFLEVFGLKDLSSLPSLRELEQMVPGSQSNNPADEDPRVREMRRLVSEMKADKSSALHYNPREDEKILKEIREKVTSIPTSTPYLDELKAAELLAQEQAKQKLAEKSENS